MRKDPFAATVVACLLASASLAAWPSLASAQPEEGPPPGDYTPPPSGPYIAADIGYNFPDSVGITPYSPPRLGLDGRHGSLVFFDRLGYRINPNWRVELEAGFRPNYVSHPGATRNVSAMANVIYDFMPGSRLTPFVGAGIGANALNVAYSNPAHGSFIAGHEVRFAWQAIGGVSYAVSRRLNLDLTYRYSQNQGGPTLQCFGSCSFAPRLGSNESNTLSLGLRYAFGAAPPPPPPPHAEPMPPPPPPPQPEMAPQPEAAPPPPPPPEPPPPPPVPLKQPRG
jgi:opacity protein-like surface antigen